MMDAGWGLLRMNLLRVDWFLLPGWFIVARVFVTAILSDLLLDGNNAHFLSAWDFGVVLPPDLLRASALGLLQGFGVDSSPYCKGSVFLCFNMEGC
jgi:hypothetical protein